MVCQSCFKSFGHSIKPFRPWMTCNVTFAIVHYRRCSCPPNDHQRIGPSGLLSLGQIATTADHFSGQQLAAVRQNSISRLQHTIEHQIRHIDHPGRPYRGDRSCKNQTCHVDAERASRSTVSLSVQTTPCTNLPQRKTNKEENIACK